MNAPSTAGSAAFRFDPSTTPVDANERAARLVDPGFGRVFTDHMAVIRYTEGQGWHDAVITARAPVTGSGRWPAWRLRVSKAGGLGAGMAIS